VKNKLMKVIAWRGISIVITLIVMWAATGDVRSATGITLLLHTILTLGHYIFETAWEKINERR
jgi:uncharacterized membrane protein